MQKLQTFVMSVCFVFESAKKTWKVNIYEIWTKMNKGTSSSSKSVKGKKYEIFRCVTNKTRTCMTGKKVNMRKKLKRKKIAKGNPSFGLCGKNTRMRRWCEEKTYNKVNAIFTPVYLFFCVCECCAFSPNFESSFIQS